MAKISISSLFELSKYLATKSGNELKDALGFLSEFSNITVQALRNGLTFAENFASEVKQVSLLNNTETVVSIASSKRPNQVLIRKVLSDQYYKVDSFGWKYNQSGSIVVNVGFAGSPPTGQAIPVEILFLF